MLSHRRGQAMGRYQKFGAGVLVLALMAALAIGVLVHISVGDKALASGTVPWIVEAVDSGSYCGEYTSLAFDLAGNPAISYHSDSDSGWLMYACRDGQEWHVEQIDKGMYTGYYTSLAFDDHGNPGISYTDETNDLLKFACRKDGSWAIQTVDTAHVAFNTSLVFDRNGNPSISYFSHSDWYDLKYAHWNGTAWAIETVDSSGDVGRGNSLALDAEGNPAISYYDWTSCHSGTCDFKLKYAHWSGEDWSIEVVDSTGNAQTYFTSLAFDPQGNAAIAYFGDWAIKYAHWNGQAWSIERLDDAGQYSDPSLAFDSLGKPAISYCSSARWDLKYACWNGVSWDMETVDSVGSVGEYSSLAFDRQGNPAISYYEDAATDGLKYAHKPGLIASFTADSATAVVEGQEVRFTDTSLGEIDSWLWNFGDGTPVAGWTAETRPPDGKLSHTYANSGNYSVSLTVTGPRGSHTEGKTDYVSVYVASEVESWAVIVGVSDYENLEPAPWFPSPRESYDLSYADNEAFRLYNQAKLAFGQSHARLLTDSRASKAEIESAMQDWLAPQEGPGDIVLLFFSGHGNSGYLSPHDSLETSYANDISWSLFGGWLDALDSERVVVILDSCESAGFADHLAKPGRIILTASAGSEDAWETSALESGVFAYYLLEALEQPSLADSNADNRVAAEEMFQYAEPKVVSYTTELGHVQHPQLYDGFAGELDLFPLATIVLDVSHWVVPLSVDGAKLNASQLPSSNTWLVGTSHDVSVPATVDGGEGRRYVFNSWSDGNTSTVRTVTVSESMTLMANYTCQYYLTVESEHGTVEGGGWCEAGREATFSVNGGSSWYRAFGGWSGDSTGSSPATAIAMDGPKTVTATWKIPNHVWALGAGIAAAFATALALIMWKLGRRLWHWTKSNFGVDFQRVE